MPANCCHVLCGSHNSTSRIALFEQKRRRKMLFSDFILTSYIKLFFNMASFWTLRVMFTALTLLHPMYRHIIVLPSRNKPLFSQTSSLTFLIDAQLWLYGLHHICCPKWPIVSDGALNSLTHHICCLLGLSVRKMNLLSFVLNFLII